VSGEFRTIGEFPAAAMGTCSHRAKSSLVRQLAAPTHRSSETRLLRFAPWAFRFSAGAGRVLICAVPAAP
jgi:hypothetical protein